MNNLLFDDIEYKTVETKNGTWNSFVYDSGRTFHEFISHKRFGTLPFIHITLGKCPETGRRRTAKGFIAIGLRAVGVLSIGLFALGIVSIGLISAGVISIGELSIAALFGVGQFTIGTIAVGQIALGIYFGLGQFATGYIAIGQFAFGNYALGQIAFGKYVYSMQRKDDIAKQFFETLPIIKLFFTR